MTFGRGDAVRIGRPSDLYLWGSLRYQLDQSLAERRSWQVHTVGYFFELQDLDGVGLLSYHWHPTGRSPITYPHLHVGGQTAPVDLSKAHLPTGPVTMIDIIRLAITELGVQPLRSDWPAVLDRAANELNI